MQTKKRKPTAWDDPRFLGGSGGKNANADDGKTRADDKPATKKAKAVVSLSSSGAVFYSRVVDAALDPSDDGLERMAVAAFDDAKMQLRSYDSTFDVLTVKILSIDGLQRASVVGVASVPLLSLIANDPAATASSVAGVAEYKLYKASGSSAKARGLPLPPADTKSKVSVGAMVWGEEVRGWRCYGRRRLRCRRSRHF